MALLPLGILSLRTVAVAEAEDKLAFVACRVEEHKASTTAAECLRRVVSGIAAAAMAAPEAAVAGGTVVDIALGVGTAQLDADFGIVALPDCPGSTRQKPLCLFL